MITVIPPVSPHSSKCTPSAMISSLQQSTQADFATTGIHHSSANLPKKDTWKHSLTTNTKSSKLQHCSHAQKDSSSPPKLLTRFAPRLISLESQNNETRKKSSSSPAADTVTSTSQPTTRTTRENSKTTTTSSSLNVLQNSQKIIRTDICMFLHLPGRMKRNS